ncbi:hydroxyethylthiazole kinase [Jeotgalibacillus marinus]|uniref:Hydroxyethylthiazole kinase n=1 Tax=Jeotgalibacillus marinus TaxID=86667 RepID=A0ABV3Q164_9BACL
MNAMLINEVRKKRPLIHHLTNQVVMNFTANGLLSFGGTPIMAKEEKEATEMARMSDGVLLNIGTIIEQEIPAMIQAGKAANQKGIPVVLDPVGVSATSFRNEVVRRILTEVKPTAIKGNAGELAHLVGIAWEIKGVDSIGRGNVGEIARKVANRYQTIAVVTGEVDVISDGEITIENKTGSAMLANVTGAGCLLGSILTACFASNDSLMESAQTAVEFYGLAAEYTVALPEVKGSGTFSPRFIDVLSYDVAIVKGDHQ